MLLTQQTSVRKVAGRDAPGATLGFVVLFWENSGPSRPALQIFLALRLGHSKGIVDFRPLPCYTVVIEMIWLYLQGKLVVLRLERIWS